MRIIHVLHSKGYGGAENHALMMMKGQRALGHEVMYAGRLDSWLGRACQEHGIPATHIRMSGLFDLRSHWALRRLARNWKADVLHGHLIRASWYVGLAAGKAGKRGQHAIAISTAHATTADKHMGRCAHIIAVSHAVQGKLVERGYEPARITVIHNGIPDGPATDRAAVRRELGIPDGQFAAVNVGRFIHDKGQDLLLKAMSGPAVDASLHLYLIGDPATDFGRALQAAKPDTPRVTYLGYRGDVQRLLPAFDAYALSSRREACPISVIEALAACVPLVATAVGGVPELVIQDQTGLLVPTEDAAGLAAGLDQLRRDEGLRQRLAATGRRFYETHLTDGVMVDKTLAVYEHARAEAARPSR